MTSTPVATSTGVPHTASEEAVQGPPPRPLRARLGGLALSGHGILMYAFLYVPIIILVVFSFNDSRFLSSWDGFTLRWYSELVEDDQTILALWNSLFVAVVSTVISTVIGTLAAMAMERHRFRGKVAMDALLYLPIIIPDIAMAIMLLAFFNLSGIGFTPWRVELFGLRLAVPYSVIIGHVSFNISFVAVIVRARLADMDQRIEEAAQDLYANAWQTFWRVTLPMMMPGIVAGALLAFTLSLDDFVITFFTSGAGFNTLPVRVFGLVKKGVTPKINAISVLMLLGSLVLVAVMRLFQKDSDKAVIDIEL
ncbi:MAG: ABC transporter permease [Anaerolineae bacterium]